MSGAKISLESWYEGGTCTVFFKVGTLPLGDRKKKESWLTNEPFPNPAAVAAKIHFILWVIGAECLMVEVLFTERVSVGPKPTGLYARDGWGKLSWSSLVAASVKRSTFGFDSRHFSLVIFSPSTLTVWQTNLAHFTDLTGVSSDTTWHDKSNVEMFLYPETWRCFWMDYKVVSSLLLKCEFFVWYFTYLWDKT